MNETLKCYTILWWFTDSEASAQGLKKNEKYKKKNHTENEKKNLGWI